MTPSSRFFDSRLGTATGVDVSTIDRDAEQLARAEGALWAWYLEWSQIARVAVTQRALLRQMGFVSTSQAKSVAPAVVDPVAPPASTAPGTPNQ